MDTQSAKQIRNNTLGLGAYSIKISTLPIISAETLPVWNEMDEDKKYNCIVCRKRKLTPWKYARHMLFDHELDLKKDEADLEEFEDWLFRIYNSNEEELKTLPCDYDSDTGKGYSEDMMNI